MKLMTERGFPNRFLGIFPVGWRALGRVDGHYRGKGIEEVVAHKFCGTPASVGEQNGTLFYYCPRCKLRLTKFTRNRK